MYIECLVQPIRVETVARAPSASDAMPTLGGHRDAPVAQHARFYLDVMAVSGTTPSMTMNIYGVMNGKPYFIAQFPVATAVGTYTAQVNNAPDLICCAPAPLSGTTPSFTCEVRCVR